MKFAPIQLGMSMLASRRKEISDENPELRHRSSQRSSNLLRHTLTDLVFSYVWWFEELSQHLKLSPYEKLVMMQLPPQEYDQEYLDEFQRRLQNCFENSLQNSNLKLFISVSLDPLMARLAQYQTACENLEAIKLHFAAKMDPFKMLIFERSITYDKYNLLEYYRSLDAMAKVYYHIFRRVASDDLMVQWMMTSLSNDIMANNEIISEINQNWARLYNAPQEIRRIMNKHLHHRRAKRFNL